jgi:hypothetical protein
MVLALIVVVAACVWAMHDFERTLKARLDHDRRLLYRQLELQTGPVRNPFVEQQNRHGLSLDVLLLLRLRDRVLGREW